MRIKNTWNINHYEKICFHMKWLHALHNYKAQSLEVRFLTCSRTFWLHILNTSRPSHGSVATFMACNISSLNSFQHIAWIMISTDHKYHFSATAPDLFRPIPVANNFIHDIYNIHSLALELFIFLLRPLIISIQ